MRLPSHVGMIWYSTPKATIGLLVGRDHKIVYSPPYGRRLVGKRAREVWDGARRIGIDVKWMPNS